MPEGLAWADVSDPQATTHSVDNRVGHALASEVLNSTYASHSAATSIVGKLAYPTRYGVRRQYIARLSLFGFRPYVGLS